MLTELVRRHGPEIEQVPLREVADRVAGNPGTQVLLGLGAVSGESAFGAVLRHPLVRSRFEDRLSSQERDAVIGALTAWSRARSDEEVGRRARTLRDAAEAAERALVAWTDGLGVTERLDDLVSKIAPFVSEEQWVVDHVAHFMTGDVRRAALGRTHTRGASAEAIKAGARRYLEDCARVVAEQKKRARRWKKAPESPELARLSLALRALEAPLTTRGLATADAGTLRLDADRPALALVHPSGAELSLAIAPDGSSAACTSASARG